MRLRPTSSIRKKSVHSFGNLFILWQSSLTQPNLQNTIVLLFLYKINNIKPNIDNIKKYIDNIENICIIKVARSFILLVLQTAIKMKGITTCNLFLAIVPFAAGKLP
jgi:hypothetical protein